MYYQKSKDVDNTFIEVNMLRNLFFQTRLREIFLFYLVIVFTILVFSRSNYALPGDFDGSGKVDESDLKIFSIANGSSSGDAHWNPDADLDGNGTVDDIDHSILSTQFGKRGIPFGLWVGDQSNRDKRLSKLSSTGTLVKNVGTFEHPLSLSSNSSEGTIWVADSSNNTVSKLSTFDGKTLVTVHGTKPYSVSVNTQDGSVWVADYHNNRIVKLLPSIIDGYTIGRDTGSHIIISGFNKPRSVSVDAKSNVVWVADTNNDRVVRLSSDIFDEYDINKDKGKHTVKSGFDTPYSVCVNVSDGTVWVADYGNDQVVKLSITGKSEIVRANGFNQPTNLDVNAIDGSVWVADRKNNEVVRLDRDGVLLKRIKGFYTPYAVSVNPLDSTCWVADFDNNQVVKLSPNGTELLRLGGFERPMALLVIPDEISDSKLPTTTTKLSANKAEISQTVTFTGKGSDPDGSIALYEWDFEGDGTFDYRSETTGITTHAYHSTGVFTPVFRVRDNDWCTTSDYSQVVKVGSLEAIASANVTSGNAPFNIKFSARFADPIDGLIDNYQWDFDGDNLFDYYSETGGDINHTYNEKGTYTATLKITDGPHTATDSVVINVFSSAPTASITVTPTEGIAPMVVNFTGKGTDPDGEILLYEWDFDGDGTYDWHSISSGEASHTYTEDVTYTAIFKITDNDGLTDTKEIVIQIGDAVPVAAANATSTKGYQPFHVNFFAEESKDPGRGSIVLYEWDFDGDGTYDFNSVDTGETSFTYNVEGTYTATLRVTDNDNNQATDTIKVDVIPTWQPTASAAAHPNIGVSPLTVVFKGEGTDPDGSIASYNWNFGDLVLDSKGYPKTQLFLGAWDSTGCDDIATIQPGIETKEPSEGDHFASHKWSSVSDTDGSFNWDKIFDNKPNSYAYSHIYIYSQTTLTVRVWFGSHGACRFWVNGTLSNTKKECKGVSIDNNNFKTTFNQGWNRILVSVSKGKGQWTLAYRITDLDNNPLQLSYSINKPAGDKRSSIWSSSTEGNTSHIYTIPGKYRAIFTVTDNEGNTDTVHKDIHVFGEPSISAIESNVTSGQAPLEVFLTGMAEDQDGTIVNYEWDFGGDGIFDWISKNTANVRHIYNSAGTYNAMLRVTDMDGYTTTETIKITVEQSPPTSVAGAAPVTGNDPHTVNFFDSSTDSDGKIAHYEWDFESDGNYDYVSSSTANTTHTYTTPGSYRATLRVTDDSGLSNSDTVDIHTYAVGTPPVFIMATPTEGPGPLEVTFYGHVKDPDGTINLYDWDFDGDGVYDRSSFDPPIAFSDMMEDGTEYWTADLPWNLTYTDYHSPSYSWTDSPDRDYENNANVSLTSTTIDLSDAMHPKLIFWHHFEFKDHDYGRVEISNDDGSSWKQLGSYSNTTVNNWSREEYDLSDYAGKQTVKVRFRVTTNASVTGDGWYLDNVWIGDSVSHTYAQHGIYPALFRVTNSEGKQFTASEPISVVAKQNVSDIWITDYGRNQIVILSDDGRELVRISGFKRPGDVKVDTYNGDVWVADRGSDRLVKLSNNVPDGYSTSVKEATPDSTSTNNRGLLFGDAISGTGTLSGGVVLDGKGDYILVPNNALLDVQSFTIEAWIKPLSDHGIIYMRGNSTGGDEISFGLDNKTILSASLDNGPKKKFRGSTNFVDGSWHHVALVYDSIGGELICYVDGKLYGTPVTISTTLDFDDSNAFIGADFDSFNRKPGKYFKGYIDEVRLWNLVRTETEILNYKDVELSDAENGLVGYWKMNSLTDTPYHKIVTGFENPYSISFNTKDQSVWVTDHEQNQITKLLSGGSKIVIEVGLTTPKRLSVDQSNGSIWITDDHHDKVVKLDSKGNELLRLGGFNDPTGITVDQNSRCVWVADSLNNEVVKLASDGNELYRVGGFDGPTEISVNQNDSTVWVTDQGNGEVVKLTPNASEIVRLSGFKSPHAVEVSPYDGTVWVVDRHNDQIVKLAPDGTELLRARGFHEPFSLSIAPALKNRSLFPVATSSLDRTSGNIPHTVTFTGSGTDNGSIVRYEWDFDGDGTYDYESPTTGNITHTYTSPGTFNPIFRVTDNEGLAGFDSSHTIYVGPVTVSIENAELEGNLPFNATLNGFVRGIPEENYIALYEWDFEGDGIFDWSSAVSPKVIHEYLIRGTYTAILRVTDNVGGKFYASTTVTVKNRPPRVKNNSQPAKGSAPLAVNLHGHGYDEDGSIVLYEWDYDGDGTYDWFSDSKVNAHFTYMSAGTYTATLRVTDNDGLTATASKVITVNAKQGTTTVKDVGTPTAQASAAPERGPIPLRVDFDATGSSDPDGNIELYSWDFNDASDRLNSKGYPLRQLFLGVWDSVACDDVTSIQPDIENQEPSEGDVFASKTWFSASDTDGIFSWDVVFGDKSNSYAYSHIYLFSHGDQTIRIWFGADDAARFWINGILVYTKSQCEKLTADKYHFDVTLKQGWNRILVSTSEGGQEWELAYRITDTRNKPLRMSYSINKPSENIPRKIWTSTKGGNTSHTYTRAGNYEATLTVTDNEGLSDTDTVIIRAGEVTESLPVAYPTTGSAPLTVRFSSHGKSPEGTIEYFNWDFDGNGTTDWTTRITENHEFTYSLPGIYRATQEVVDNLGFRDTKSVTITVSQTDMAPVAEAFAAFPEGETPLVVNFTGLGQDSDGFIKKYEWDFDGDGKFDLESPSTGKVNHTYTAEDTYDALLRVTDDEGNTDTDSVRVEARPQGTQKAKADVTYIDNSGGSLTVKFSGNGSGDGNIILYEWDFEGDGKYDWNSEISGDTSYTYSKPGTYNAIFRVTDNEENTDTDVKKVTVLPVFSTNLKDDIFDPTNGEAVTINSVFTAEVIVTIKIKNRSGKRVRTLVDNKPRSAGFYSDTWDGRDDVGQIVDSGVYVYTIEYSAGEETIIYDITNSVDQKSYDPKVTLPDSFDPFRYKTNFIRYTLDTKSEITIYISPFKAGGGRSTGFRVKTLLTREPQSAGDYVLVWDGTDDAGNLVQSDSSYIISVFGWRLPENSIIVETRPIISDLLVSPSYLNPAARPYDDTSQVRFSYTLSKSADVTATIYNEKNYVVRQMTMNSVPAGGGNTIKWDGRHEDGTYAAAGRYRLRLIATDTNGNRSMEANALLVIFY